MAPLFFIIHAETPSKKNSRINLKNGISIPSAKYRDWHKNAISELLPQIKCETISSPVSISLNFTHGDKRRRDSDNGTSSIMDLLVDAHILQDDNWQIVRRIYINNDYEKNNPKCEIIINDITDKE